MKRILPLLIIATALLNSCVKSSDGCTPQDASVEKPAMVSFCNANGITYTEHSSGILYRINNPGTGVTPTTSSKIFIYYTGKLMDGTTFDYQNNPSATGWVLSSLIEGWKIGIPLLKKGGEIEMVIPSYLAYSCNGTGPIPGNSPLYFKVGLTDVQ